MKNNIYIKFLNKANYLMTNFFFNYEMINIILIKILTIKNNSHDSKL